MPRRQNSRSVQEIWPTSAKLDAIDSWLQKMLDRFPEKGQLQTDEIKDWHKDLSDYSLAAIDFGFEEHRRNGLFFPRYKQIIEACDSYKSQETVAYGNPNCDAICKARHGKGYNETDMLWLFRRYMQTKDSLPNRPMTDGEIESLLGELDTHRGSGPAWRG